MVLTTSVLLTTGMASALPLSAGAESETQQKPNVIVILVDDQGYGGVGCYPHNKPIDTPNIDRLASEGVQFTQGYTTGHYSSPTRAGLLTGRYQESFGFYGLDAPHAGGIPVSETLISELMSREGYNTACIGKWHVGDNMMNHPNNRSFNYFYGFVDGLHDYFDHTIGGSWMGWHNGLAFMMENREPVVEMKYATYEYTDRAIDFIDGSDGEPFFLYLPYNAIHSPLQAPQDLIEAHAKNPAKPTKEEIVYAMTAALDNSVGRILDLLDEKGIRDNTLIFYLSDNGGLPAGDVWDLRGQKGSYFEGGIRVPYIVSWTGALPRGRVMDQPVLSIDIAPTIMGVLGLDHGNMHGVNLMPYMQGEKKGAPHEVMYWSAGKPDGKPLERTEFAVRKGRWKLVSDPRVVKDFDLFDIEADPFERKGLREQHPEVYRELLGLYTEWIERMPHSVVTRENEKIGGVPMMNRYMDNYKKAFGTAPRMRPVNLDEYEKKETR